MASKLILAPILLCTLSYGVAATTAIGTASARGDMRVDSYNVKGNATLFDGSVVETGQATADLRLDRGVEITMSTGARGTLYSNRLVLQQGKSEVAANSSFRLEANGLRVTPDQPNSRGMVSLKPGNTVEVAALTGGFGVTNANGVLLASVRPGRVASFAIQKAEKATQVDGLQTSVDGLTGIVSCVNGHYYLEAADNVKYELVGRDLKKYVGAKVQVSGTVTSKKRGAIAVISISSLAINGAVAGGGMSATGIIVTSSVLVGAGVGTGVGIYEANKSSTPASR